MAPLDRFVDAQASCYARVCMELADGAKQTHWMWFIFPQLAGLGRSEMARRYAIADLSEASAYLGHPLLGVRYDECCRLVLRWAGERSAEQVFGGIDALKLRSSLTLFERAVSEPTRALILSELLEEFFSGERDQATLVLLDS